jgi:choline dehydrogenase-like flavoprotein
MYDYVIIGAGSAYLKPALRRPNLTVRTNALVTRLLFDCRRVAGVAYVCDGKHSRVTRHTRGRAAALD